MTRTAEGVFEARMARLPDAIGFAEDFCRQHGIVHDDRLRLTLVVEELFTNTVEHGHALAHLAEQPPSLDDALDARSPGGLGIHLVEQLATSARYAREDGRNRLWIVLRRQGPDETPAC